MTKTASVDALQVPSDGTIRILPDSEGVFDAVARIGYEFEHAIADLVDNSIDAKARNVLVRFIYDAKAVRSVAVIDDGEGMNDDSIDAAMAFGARTGKGADSLGKYGMGLKSATFSQCNALTVISRQSGRAVGRRWTAEKARADWSCEILNGGAAGTYMRQHRSHRVDTSESGTIVEWGDLDAFTHSMIPPGKTIDSRFRQLNNHLGLVFHRLIEGGKISIQLDAVNPSQRLSGIPVSVGALNPFPRFSGLSGYPKQFAMTVGGQELGFTGHVWKRNATEAGFKLGDGRLSKKQGIYLYRNDRLIQAGGWNGLRNDAEVHLSLARVELDLPSALDSMFKLTVQKSAVSMPEDVLKAIKDARSGRKRFSDFLSDAETAYRDQVPARHVRHGLVPASGINKALARRFESTLGAADDEDDTVRFEWIQLDQEVFFNVDSECRTIYLNSVYREAVLMGHRRSSGDAPLVKTLLMLLFKDDLARKRRMKTNEERLDVLNALMVDAVRSQW
jgi:hypothetical protein